MPPVGTYPPPSSCPGDTSVACPPPHAPVDAPASDATVNDLLADLLARVEKLESDIAQQEIEIGEIQTDAIKCFQLDNHDGLATVANILGGAPPTNPTFDY